MNIAYGMMINQGQLLIWHINPLQIWPHYAVIDPVAETIAKGAFFALYSVQGIQMEFSCHFKRLKTNDTIKVFTVCICV